MTDHDTKALLAPGDLPAAIGLLTRLPVPVDGEAATLRGAAAAWAYPLVGFVVALCAAFTGSVALWLGLAAPLAAALVLACSIIVTGALHEDGLADSADGLWGGWDKELRLKIMKDSRTGAYGVIAMIVSLILRWQALTIIVDANLLWPALIAVAMISRAAMVATMGWLPHARDGGLSQRVGRPARRTVILACLLAVPAGFLLGLWAVPLCIVAGLATVAVAQIAKAKIGGQTGDILGATQQIVEITLLLTITALL